MIYPHIYFRLTDRLAYQDIANFQMILSLDNNCQVFDYFLTNYGLDSQLKVLISSIKNSSLVKTDFAKFKNFDPQKLRVELIFFLRLIIQICT